MEVICPYYVDENKATITCEDVCRSHKTADRKWQWMDMYCLSWDWMKCPYAADLSDAYRRFEEGDKRALDEHKEKAKKGEIHSLRIKLGQANKRIERQQKKIDELRAVNQSFTNVNMNLEKQNKDLHRKWRELSDRMAEYEEAIASQVQIIADAYEARLAYMIDRYGTFSDLDVDEWRKDKAFALVYDEDDDGYPCWNLVFKEDEEGDEESDGHEDTDIQTEEQK